MDDKTIIGLYTARDESALRETAAKYSAYLGTIARNILNSPEDSEECVNDTYLQAWNRIPPDVPVKLSLYLGKITRELSIDRLRKKRALKRGGSQYQLSLDELCDCVPGGDDPEQETDLKLLSESIGAYLRGLSADARDIFICRYYFCDSVRSIAGSFGISESKVKSALYRARIGLKKHLEEEGFTV